MKKATDSSKKKGVDKSKEEKNKESLQFEISLREAFREFDKDNDGLKILLN